MSNIKTYFCPSSNVDEKILPALRFDDDPAFVLGFISPHVDFRKTAERIRSILPNNVRVLLTSTAGELLVRDDSTSPYCETGASWDRVVFQSFSKKMISGIQTVNIPLGNEDIRSGTPVKTPERRIDEITQRLKRMSISFDIDYRDTVCYTLIDGLSNSENFFMEAVYESSAVPCLLIGGSAGGTLDFKDTYIYDGATVLQNHAVMTFIKVAPGFRFGVFTTHNFERTNISFVILECDLALRRVRSVFDEKTLTSKSFIASLCATLSCKPEELDAKLIDYTFGVEIEGELYIRSVSGINLEKGFVSFYCDIDAGDRLFLLKRTDFVAKTNRDYATYMKGKPQPIGGILSDCILRRLFNENEIGSLSTFKETCSAGASTFGELFGINVNQTLTALFFYDISSGAFHDAHIENFLMNYSNFKSYYLKRKLARQKIIERIYQNTLSSVFSSSDLIVSLSKAFDQAVIRMNDNLRDLSSVMEKLTSFSTSMEATGKENAALYTQLRSLTEQVRQIDGVLETITDIAEQTGVLSINASIQAARAGDRGKGFAVVAGEVRKLAEQIRSNLQSIDITTGGITKSVDQIACVVDASGKKLETAFNANKAIHDETVAIIDDITRTKEALKAEDQGVKRILEYLVALKNSKMVIDILAKERI